MAEPDDEPLGPYADVVIYRIVEQLAATPGNRCRTGAETYAKGHRERREVAERGPVDE